MQVNRSFSGCSVICMQLKIMEFKLYQYFVSFLIFVLIYRSCVALEHSSCQFNSKIKLLSRYDFIIVGAGSAGAVVANRLSKSNDVTVLLLEAGGEEDPILNEIPQLTNNLRNSYQDWLFDIVEQRSPILGTPPKKFVWSKGKVLGGTSSINGMMYIRGNHKDYDSWNEIVGGGWSWNEVLPYFRKSEDNQIKHLDATYHGTGGYLTVTESNARDYSTDLILKAGKEIGLEERDVNGEIQTGIMPIQYTIRNGARCSTNKAFLQSAANRPNLHVVTHAYVTKIILEVNSKNETLATGVMFQCFDSRLKAEAKREVILSAGTINSPQILLLSGIGPEHHLKKFNIKTMVNLQGVGENLHDHIVLVGFDFVKDKDVTDPSCPKTDTYQSELLEWAFNRTGPLTISMAAPNLVGFIEAGPRKANSGNDSPNTQLFLTQYFGKADETDPLKNSTTQIVSICMPALLKILSRGTVRLKSDDPLAPPAVDPQYFQNPEDFEGFLNSAKICLALANTNAFAEEKVRLQIESYPACEKYQASSEEYLRCAVQQGVAAASHCVGSCKMGNSSDRMAVVDSQLRVFNVTGLRVIDVSIMPEITTGNTNAPAIMIGERGSDFIKESWKNLF